MNDLTACRRLQTLPGPERRPVAVRVRRGSQRVLRVPADYPTVQAAVDTSAAGDLMLVAPSDHVMTDVPAFHAAIQAGRKATDGNTNGASGAGVVTRSLAIALA